MCEEIEILKIIAIAIAVFGIVGVLFMTARDLKAKYLTKGNK